LTWLYAHICSLITNIDPTDPKATKDAKVSSKSSATSAEVSKSRSSKAATEEKVKKIVTSACRSGYHNQKITVTGQNH
jgi:hypothetical protein